MAARTPEQIRDAEQDEATRREYQRYDDEDFDAALARRLRRRPAPNDAAGWDAWRLARGVSGSHH